MSLNTRLREFSRRPLEACTLTDTISTKSVGETVPGPLLGQTESLTTATHEFRSRIWKHHLEQCLNLVAEIKLLNYTIAIGQGLTTLAANAALLNDALKKGLIIVEPFVSFAASNLNPFVLTLVSLTAHSRLAATIYLYSVRHSMLLLLCTM